MATEFYKDKSGFIVDSKDVNCFKNIIENKSGYWREDSVKTTKDYLDELTKIDNAPTKRSIKIICRCTTEQGEKLAKEVGGKGRQPNYSHYGWHWVFWSTRFYLAQDKEGNLYTIAPSMMAKLAETCKIRRGGWYEGNFKFRDFGKLVSLCPVK